MAIKKSYFSVTILIFTLGVLLPLFFLNLVDGSISINFLLLYFLVFFCTCRLAIATLKGKKSFTLMLFYIFVYVFLAFQPMISVWSNIYPHSELSLSDLTYFYTILIIIIGIISFEFGYYNFKSNNTSIKFIEKNEIHKTEHFSLSRLVFLTAFISFLVFLTIIVYSINIYLSLRDGGNFNDTEGAEMSGTQSLLIITTIRVMSAILLFIAFHIKRISLARKNKLLINILLIYLIILNLFVSNPLNAPRLWSGSIILTIIIMLTKWKGPTSFFKWTMAATFAMLILFSGTDPRRIFSQTIMRGDDVTFSTVLTTIGEGVATLPKDANFDAFQIIAYTTRYTSEKGLSYGYQTLLPIFFWVPRSLWPGKPIGSSDVVGTFAGFFSVNVSSPLWTEGYINFGLIGVILFLILFGRVASWADNYLNNKIYFNTYKLILVSYFASNTFILLRGDLTSGTIYLQMIILFSFIFISYIKIKNKFNYN